MTAPILVTGGTGRLGRFVVARLLDAGREVRVLTRQRHETDPRAVVLVGDLLRGEGIEAAVRDASVIINCATDKKGDARAAANLVSVARRFGSPHLVQPSIVGIDAMARWGYVKTKLEVERIVETGGLPWTILRATQFYDYCFENSRRLAKSPLLAPVPRGFRVRPVDSRDVATRLVELAIAEPAGRASDLSGPEETSWTDMFRDYLAATHRHRLTVPVLVPGSKAVRRGALLPPPGHAEGTRTWGEFLAEQVRLTAAAS